MNQTDMKKYPLALCAVVASTLLLNPMARAADTPAQKCTYVEVADMPLKYAGPSLVPAVDGMIDGAPAVMLVDTGAFDTSLTMNAVLKRDLVMHMTGRYVDGIGGSSRLYAARIGDFAIGPVKSQRKRIDLYVIGETSFTPAYDAIVGAPFLLQADLEFDLRAKRMKFFRPQNCDRDTPLNYWKEDAVSVPFEFTRSTSPNPHFTVLVNGKELDAFIDTGASSSFLTLRGAKRLGIDVKSTDVTRLADSGGIGSDRAANWSAPVQSVQIGGELIKDVRLGVVDAQSEVQGELLLGQDFLRTHRVLFAMSQRKVYLAYLGGEIFKRGAGLEPWIVQEADGGNADAQYALATMLNTGRGTPRDPKQAQSWLEKAAAAGQPNANLVLGRQQMQAGKLDEAIPKLRAALDQLPAEHFGTLWLYNARVRKGDAALAKTELEASIKRQRNDNWPEPITEFYLGKLDASGLLKSAADDKQAARARTCMANAYMREWHAARDEKAQADALLATLRAECGPARPAAAPAAPAPAPAAAP
ncbi:retroviral-like aspartic protease family protein [Massilia norwichensis]|uniref:Aspartyl protease family protein n=1 Tax=Massilia norwichensis TaxID=1442366 RepID=A0ABT2A311_9BURK|nr:retroviral-like aspartic protease family protein [Massilia norwichensis]MCS0588581.1 aspartyl protease family protein [Massilia norwichensis]